jgi:hypothetical protein
MIYSMIPFLNLWAAHRIKKLVKFVVLLIVISVINLAVSFFIPFPYSAAHLCYKSKPLYEKVDY